MTLISRPTGTTRHILQTWNGGMVIDHVVCRLDRMSEAIAAAKPAAGGDAAITKEGVMAVIAAATEDANAVKMEYGSKSVLSSGLCTDVELPGVVPGARARSEGLLSGGFKFKVDEPEMMPGGWYYNGRACCEVRGCRHKPRSKPT